MGLTLTNDFANGDDLDASKLQTNMTEIEAKFGNIGATDLSADAVTNAKIADDAVDTENIADDAITPALIDDNAIVAAGIADDALDSQHYTDGSIDFAHLADETPNVWFNNYTGDGGTQSITGCPFTPTFAIVFGLSGITGGGLFWKHSSMAGSDSVRDADQAVGGTWITSLDGDGISVTGTANTSAETYLAVCLRSKS